MTIPRRKKLPEMCRIAKLELRPGDTVVLQTDLFLDRDQAEAIRDSANRQFAPLKIKVVILTAGLKLAILRKRRKARAA